VIIFNYTSSSQVKISQKVLGGGGLLFFDSHCTYVPFSRTCCYLPHSYTAYSMTGYKIGFHLSVSVSVCAHSHVIKLVFICLSVYLSVRTLTVASWSIFMKIGADVRTPKNKDEFVGSISHHPFPISPQNLHFRPRGLKNPCRY